MQSVLKRPADSTTSTTGRQTDAMSRQMMSTTSGQTSTTNR